MVDHALDRLRQSIVKINEHHHEPRQKIPSSTVNPIQYRNGNQYRSIDFANIDNTTQVQIVPAIPQWSLVLSSKSNRTLPDAQSANQTAFKANGTIASESYLGSGKKEGVKKAMGRPPMGTVGFQSF